MKKAFKYFYKLIVDGLLSNSFECNVFM